MFAIKQVSLMALLIALAYAAPQLENKNEKEEQRNSRNLNTEDYIDVSCGIKTVR